MVRSETSQERPTRPVRLIIADDYALVRRGLGSMLAGEPDLEVIGEAANGREALELCRRLKPELVLMDVGMPDMDGLEATWAIKREFPATSVVVVTIHENPDYLFEALKAGAVGYVLKDATQKEVITAVRQVLGGESPLNSALAARLLRRLVDEENRKRNKERPGGGPPSEELEKSPESLQPFAEGLTVREIEVLGLLAQGHTNREIAQNLVLSSGTVKVHVQRIIRKLRVSDRTQAAVRAIELGLVSSKSD
jgi:DNA-binding NarL/FixJ family response regulator